MKLLKQIVLLAAAAAVGFWLWTIFFPNDERLVRKHLADTAQAASLSGSEGPLSQLGKITELSGCFTPEVELDFDVPRQGRFTLNGRDEIIAFAGARARDSGGTIKVDFLDVTVQVGQDRQSATAVLTARAQVPRERDFFVQEMKFSLKKIKRRWYINRVETVKTLSAAPTRQTAPLLP